MLFSKRNENRAWSQARVHIIAQSKDRLVVIRGVANLVKRPWGRGCGLLRISFKVWETRLTQQISYPLLHKIQPIIIEENTKAVSPLKQQVFSLNACLWLLFLPSKILVFNCSVNVLFYYHHKLYISLNSYKGLTTLKESLRAAKRPLENVIKTFPSNSVRVWAEKRINKL